MKKILLESKSKNQYFTLVDDEDYERVLAAGPWKLKVSVGANTFYTYSWNPVDKKQILLHRFILKIKTRKIKVDHKNGNGLDNQKHNLRLATSQSTAMHKPNIKRKRKTGVRWLIKKQKWSAHINFRGFAVNLGLFDEHQKAAEVRDRKYDELKGYEFGENSSTWATLLNEEIDSRMKAERKLARSRKAGKPRNGLQREARPIIRRAIDWP